MSLYGQVLIFLISFVYISYLMLDFMIRSWAGRCIRGNTIIRSMVATTQTYRRFILYSGRNWWRIVRVCYTVFGWNLWRTDQVEFPLLFFTFWYNLTWTQPRRPCCSCVSLTLPFIWDNSLFSPVLHQLSEYFSLPLLLMWSFLKTHIKRSRGHV